MVCMWVLVSVTVLLLYRIPSSTCWEDCLLPLVLAKCLLEVIPQHHTENSKWNLWTTQYILVSMWKISWPWECGFVPGASVLFHSPIGLLWARTSLFWVCSSVVLCEVWEGYASLVLRIVLAVLAHVWFHINFRITGPSSVKNVLGNLIEIVWNICRFL